MQSSRFIIPDIHGHRYKLELALSELGFLYKRGAWRHPMGGKAIFLGDFIDRGPDQAGVLRTVRDMVEAGSAEAIMGNHELNAVHYHSTDPETGAPLRAHSEKNTKQHGAFLSEFPHGSPETRRWIDWMSQLPLAYEEDGIRAVHACWHAPSIAMLRRHTVGMRLSPEQIWFAARAGTAMNEVVEILCKGPERSLPEPFVIHDSQGVARKKVRVKWWPVEGVEVPSWRDVAISVDDVSELPEGPAPDDVRNLGYGSKEPVVFFGHYWLTGRPVRQAHNVMCLDYSAGLGGPLASYRVDPWDEDIDLSRLRMH